MKTRTMIAALTLLLSGTAAADAQRVTVVGCPAAGAVPKCLVIRGTDNVTYNISDASRRPEIGQRAIRLTGTAVKRTSECMQGIVLVNISWTYTDQSCK